MLSATGGGEEGAAGGMLASHGTFSSMMMSFFFFFILKIQVLSAKRGSGELSCPATALIKTGTFLGVIAKCRSKVLENAVQQNAPREHSAILLTCVKLPPVSKTFVLSIFEWLLKTCFTLLAFISISSDNR